MKKQKPAHITPTEAKVAIELCNQKANKEIADALHIAEPTVNSHISHIMEKYHLTCRIGIALLAVQMKLVDIDKLQIERY